ncbi:MAG TPA: NBR1-Ig-like domain-containing protein, partial [Anaerolineales bacterium]|nr:NBR1-Ig-like domain-containing protein [Anaerolineales bacterium]
MIKKITLTLLLLYLLTSCGTAPTELPTSTPVPSATPIPPTPTTEPVTPTDTAIACENGAVLVEDVTYPDNTLLTAGEKFTKTWKLQNTGTCVWSSYTVAFVSGDKMEAPEAVPVPETEAQSTVDVSVELIAPAQDGAYTANFELRDAEGKSVPVGTEPTFWVKIIVGEAADPLGVKQRIGNCAYTENPEYVEAMIDLINKTRTDTGLKVLTVNEQLTEAAQAHSLDMAC